MYIVVHFILVYDLCNFGVGLCLAVASQCYDISLVMVGEMRKKVVEWWFRFWWLNYVEGG